MTGRQLVVAATASLEAPHHWSPSVHHNISCIVRIGAAAPPKRPPTATTELANPRLPIGIQRPGCIGRFGTNKPIAFLFNAAAICNGPVLPATMPSQRERNPINSCRLSLPVRSITWGGSVVIHSCNSIFSVVEPLMKILNG